MSKELIEQLHPVGFATQAKRIEELGKRYGVLPTTISNIAVGRSWSWV